MKNLDKNYLHTKLTNKIMKDIFSEIDITKVIKHKWDILDFSSVFSLEFSKGLSLTGVYIKIPKSNINYTGIVPICENDRLLAIEEYRSLQYLKNNWNNQDHNVNFVNPLYFYQEYNAIVTQKIYGKDLSDLFRTKDTLSHLLPNYLSKVWMDNLGRISKSIRKYHDTSCTNVSQSQFYWKNEALKVERLTKKLEYLGVSGSVFNPIKGVISKYYGNVSSVCMANTLKGLDIRNMLIDNNNNISILDPGKLKTEPAVAGFARYFFTTRIIYWGKLFFFLKFKPNIKYDDHIIAQYGPMSFEESKLFKLFILKELLKHWHSAHFALDCKRWPNIVKKIIRIIYIDRFYKAEFTNVMTRHFHYT